MNKRYFIYCFIIFFSICTSCKKEKARLMPRQVYDKLVSKCPGSAGKQLEIYYMDGDCSMCIAKALLIDSLAKKKDDVSVIFVVRTENQILTNYYFRLNRVQACILQEKDSILKKSSILFNEAVLISNELVISPLLLPENTQK